MNRAVVGEFIKEFSEFNRNYDVDISVFKNIDSVIMLRTATRTICEELIKQLISVNPAINITFVIRDFDEEYYRNSYPMLTLVVYPQLGDFEEQLLLTVVDLKKFDTCLIAYNNIYGQGYSNIHAIFSEFKNTYTFNHKFKLSQIANIKKKINNDRFFDDFVRWYTENIEMSEADESGA